MEAFGSYVSGFYNSTSDLDMSLEGSWVKDNSMPDLKPIDQMGNWGKNTRAKMLKKLCSILKKAKVRAPFFLPLERKGTGGRGLGIPCSPI